MTQPTNHVASTYQPAVDTMPACRGWKRTGSVAVGPPSSPTTVRNRRSAYERDVRLQVFPYHAR